MGSMTARSDRTGFAIFLMVAAMVGFALADTLIKWSSETAAGGAATGQIMVYLGISGLILFGGTMAYSGERLTRHTLLDRMVLFRTFGDVIGVIGVTTSLTLMPVGDVSAILQIQPIVVMLGAAWFLKERVTTRRWIAVAVAFFGVMVIVRPGMAAFHPASAFVLLGVLGLSIRDLGSRALDPSHSSVVVSGIGCAALIPVGILIHFIQGEPGDTSVETNIILIIASITGVIAYYAITHAMRLGEVSIVAPFRYSRIIAAFVVAYLLLGERPDVWTILGSVIVVSAGIWVLVSERRTVA